jgi:hypothetical protein
MQREVGYLKMASMEKAKQGTIQLVSVAVLVKRPTSLGGHVLSSPAIETRDHHAIR